MVLVCFVLDLCNLSPPLFTDLKQCLLHLANFYAISSPSSHQSQTLIDKIGLCYLFKSRSSFSHELKVAYSPRGNFSLRDFHHAVNNLPRDSFSPEINDSGSLRSQEAKLASILVDNVLYSWGDKDVMKKVIFLSSCMPDSIDFELKMTLMVAADKCVSVEFAMFEQSSSHLVNLQDNVNSFTRSISDLDNCSFQTYLPESRVFHGLVKRWLQELNDDMEEPLQARFIFKSSLIGSLNQICCSLSKSVCQIIDGFNICQTCRCHGSLLDKSIEDKNEGASCPVTGHDLGISDVIENSVQVGDKTILFMPSFQSSMKLHHVSPPIDFNVIERTNLSSFSEGLIIGSSYFVTPSACYEMETSSDELDRPELDAQIFQGICSFLHTMDQGLVCSSYCNVETMREGAFYCYYLVQPSDNGPMLLRRLAGSEEVSPMPDANRFLDSSVAEQIQNSIQASLLQMELRDYNPVFHERGFHQKLNSLVKESLKFGSIPPKLDEATSEPHSDQLDSSELIEINAVDLEKETPLLDLTDRDDKTAASIAEEWEQLVVNELPRAYSPTCISKHKMDQGLSSPDINKQLDIKTSRILERLEVPRQLKTKAVSPTITSSQACMSTKKPLIPFQPTNATDQSLTSSQLMKPNFQRLKRKHK